jgi:hypothetical protein
VIQIGMEEKKGFFTKRICDQITGKLYFYDPKKGRNLKKTASLEADAEDMKYDDLL